MSDFETMLRLRRIETQTGLLQSMTHLKDGSQKGISRGLVEAERSG